MGPRLTIADGPRSARSAIFAGLTLWAAVTALGALALGTLVPPRLPGPSVGSTEFSAGRSLRHVVRVARRPHPVGSPEHDRVRDYILGELKAQGLAPEIQTTSTARQLRPDTVIAAKVENIAARLPGRAGGSKAVMLVGHYDTMPQSPGASDDSSGVATLLETLRALRAGPPLERDVIFLFTDGEELGLLGAQAFVEQHGWARDVGVVLNFEARGTRGPTIMFETSPGNRRLIEELAATPAPVAFSFANDVYRRLSNRTDFTLFRQAGMPGMNFAYIENLAGYHRPGDTLESLDSRSLQHNGSYALALTRRFASGGLDGLSGDGKAIYFTLPGGLARYRQTWALPLALLALVLVLAAAGLGVRRGLFTRSGTLLALVLWIVALAAAWPAATASRWLLRPVLDLFRASPAAGSAPDAALGLALLFLALGAALYGFARRRLSPAEAALSGLLIWLLLTLGTAVFLPDSSYLFVWPTLSGALACGALWAAPLRARSNGVALLLLLLGIAPMVLLWTPVLALLGPALDREAALAIAVLAMLLLAGAAPQVEVLSAARRWLPAVVLLALGAAWLTAAHLELGGNAGPPPAANSLFYALDPAGRKAYWVTLDSQPDEWTARFLTAHPPVKALPDFFGSSTFDLLAHPAPALSLPSPRVAFVAQEVKAGRRTLRLRITSPRRAAVVRVSGESSGPVRWLRVNDRPVTGLAPAGPPSGQPMSLVFSGLREDPLELTLEAEGSGRVLVRVFDQSFGLPVLEPAASSPRPRHLQPGGSALTDSVHVLTTATF